ncbi:DUF1775 domain-containing protein [Virgisporangium ochraceum]|uniref:DUF1775 domain-containing protein n=1 Tax=Virgisporangium ochraceum TaxID=65505 RepID=UPI0019433251|nr:DUF1775 domain-containing protein [Virgisporangium ochraceum]
MAVFGLATPAAADVSFDSQQGQRTGGARVAFRVTNEHPTASIVKVEVRLPGDLRLPEVYPIAVADWAPSITMTRVDDNPSHDYSSAVVWITMPGREIKPGGTSLLPLAMGPMPDREAVYLDVTQWRSDGSSETWAGVDVPAAGAQHPAMKLELAPLEPGQVPQNHHGGAAASGAPEADVVADPVADDGEGSSGAASLAVVLLVIAALTAFALYWQRRRGASRTDDGKAEESPGFRVPAQRAKAAPSKKATPAQKSGPAKKAQAPVKAGKVAAGKAPAGKVATEKVTATDRTSAVAVQRRTVVRTTATRKVVAGRRTTARKSIGGAATATVARRGGNVAKRAGKTDGDNA